MVIYIIWCPIWHFFVCICRIRQPSSFFFFFFFFFFLSNLLEFLIELSSFPHVFAPLFSFIENFHNSLYFAFAIFLLFTFFLFSPFLSVQAKTLFKRNNGNWGNSNATLCCFFTLHHGIPTHFSPTNSYKTSDDFKIIDDGVYSLCPFHC